MAGKNPGPTADWIRSLLDEHERSLLRYACSLLGDVDLARDAVQESFLRLCRETEARNPLHARSWLFTVCRNLCIDMRRKEKRMRALTSEESNTPASPELSPDHVVDRRDAAVHVMNFVSRLPENQQEVMRLKFQNGMTYREIAEVTGLTVSHVGVLLHKAIHTVRQRVAHAT